MTDLQKTALQVTATLVSHSIKPTEDIGKHHGKALADTYKKTYVGVYEFLKELENENA